VFTLAETWFLWVPKNLGYPQYPQQCDNDAGEQCDPQAVNKRVYIMLCLKMPKNPCIPSISTKIGENGKNGF
jgi:hypothetical protein